MVTNGQEDRFLLSGPRVCGSTVREEFGLFFVIRQLRLGSAWNRTVRRGAVVPLEKRKLVSKSSAT